MAKAAAHLNLTQPAVSKAISELERTLGVRLIDRSRQGIEPTDHGRALIKRGIAIFDELRQGVNELESLSDPAVGEVRVAASVPMAAGLLPVIIGRFSRQYPRITIYAREVLIGALESETPPYRDLYERTVDLVLGPVIRRNVRPDLNVEVLFDDPAVVACGKQNGWARRRAMSLLELADEPWCLPPSDSIAGRRCVEIFRASGMDVPRRNVTSASVHLQLGLLTTQRYLTIFPGSLMHFSARRFGLKRLPINLAARPLAIGILTLKDRTRTRATQLFMQVAQEVAQQLTKPNQIFEQFAGQAAKADQAFGDWIRTSAAPPGHPPDACFRSGSAKASSARS